MLATIHRVDVHALGRSDFGRPGHYFERQMHRWRIQYHTALPEDDATVERLIKALVQEMPADDGASVLLHGDSRLDNLMFDADGRRIVAVFDWELSTLGHPLADLDQFLGPSRNCHPTTCCLAWPVCAGVPSLERRWPKAPCRSARRSTCSHASDLRSSAGATEPRPPNLKRQKP
jgi:hypothetical protein